MPSTKKTHRMLYAAGSIALACVIYWIAGKPSSPANEPKEGMPAPAARLVDLSGQRVDLAQYRGKVVLLDFWATWCDSCTQELPDLKKIHAELHPHGFEILAASVDEGGRKALLPFVAQNSIEWHVLMADSDTVAQYAVYALPTKFLIDQNGILNRKYIGSVEPQQLESDIKTLLGKKVS